MTNTKLFLLLGTSLSFLPQTLNAQCVSPIQDCYALGYTQTSCPNGKGVKCPFGSGWYCGGGAAEDCIKLGYDKDCTGAGESGSGETCNGKYQSCTCDSSYKYNCSGTGYSGGSGTACGGKYTKCTCTSGYSWNGSSCTLSCASSYKYTCTGTGYSGGSGSACGGKYTKCTCSSGYEWKNGSCQKINLCANKTNGAYNEIYCCNGTVVGVKASGMSFYVGMQDLGYMNWTSANSQCKNYVSCSNVTSTLPSISHLDTIYQNVSQVNTLLSASGGTQFKETHYWSSTGSANGNEYGYYAVNMSYDTYLWSPITNNHYVRPVLFSY